MLLALDMSAPRLDRVRALLPFAVIAATAALAFAALCDAVGDHDGVTALDHPVSVWVAAHRSLAEGQAALLVAKATSPVILIGLVVATAILLRRSGFRLESTLLMAGTALAYAAGAIGKVAEHRARPSAPVNLAPETEASFPSGHVLVIATVAFLALVLAWRHLSRAGRALGALAATFATTAMSIDRLVAGAHWLTDVVGAVALAAVVVALVAGIFTWLRPAMEADRPARGLSG